MKQIVFYTLAATLVLCAGCKRNEGDATERMSAEKVVEETAEVTALVAEKTPKATAVVEEKPAEVTKKPETITPPKATAISSLSVKTENVMDDLNQSVEEIKQKVAHFDKAQTLAYANKYKDVLLEKKAQVIAVVDKINGLSLTDAMGEKGKILKTQLAQYTDQLNALKTRYSVYLDTLKGLGVDLSTYGL